jgi:FKBP-type peptidyl-prolyl cis-trans isomerase
VVGVTAAVVQQPFPAFADETLPSGVAIKVVKSGNGPQPDIGELAAIRFASFAGENKIDDIFETPEPYYTRVGSGGLIKGVEEVLPKMRVGDRWVLTVPVSYMTVCHLVYVFLYLVYIKFESTYLRSSPVYIELKS